jgi:hypothetical protein
MVYGGWMMSENIAKNLDNPVFLRKRGIEALTDALGPIGRARFFQQYGLGGGDYTAERLELLTGINMDDFDRWREEKKPKAEDGI